MVNPGFKGLDGTGLRHDARRTMALKFSPLLIVLLALSPAALAQVSPSAAPSPQATPFSYVDKPPGSARPAPQKRKFTSVAVEEEIARVKAKIADPELARIFEASYPNTLDTTVSFSTVNDKPDTFIITGDIEAMWLRDSSAQVQGYLHLCSEDAHLAAMIAGLIHRQSACILIDPYANAYQKNASKPSPHHKDLTEMRPGVFEHKWELDSLCYCIRLDYQYWKITGDQTVFDPQWQAAMRLVDATFRDQQRINNQGLYKYSGGRTGDLGYGKPVKPTGMICSMFRPSDDPATYLYNIPDNLFAVTALRELAEMAGVLMPRDHLAADCQALAGEVEKGIQDYGIVNDPKWGKIYAFEVDGLGHALLMDDAGYPDLVSIPYLTPSLAGDPLTLASRHFALSPDNPFYIQGAAAVGTGSPHKGKGNVWPMGILMQAITSTDDAEIMNCLEMLKMSSVGTGFIHESFSKDNPLKYSRGWFAWVNNLFGELIIKLLAERPALLAKPLAPWYGPVKG